jgi:hypothetical protein
MARKYWAAWQARSDGIGGDPVEAGWEGDGSDDSQRLHALASERVYVSL